LRRNFLLTTWLAFALLYGGAISAQWLFLREQALDDVKEHALALTEALRMELGEKVNLSAFLSRLGEPASYQVFNRVVLNKVGTLGLLKVKIFDQDSSIIYATDPELRGIHVQDDEVTEALHGEIGQGLITSDVYTRKYGQPTEQTMTETYVPLADTSGGRAKFVLEAYHDFAGPRAHFRRNAFLNGAVLTVLVALALGLISWVYYRARKLESEVASLTTLLPICAHCKKIRVEHADRPNQWVPVEQYFALIDSVDFSHTVCDECLALHYPPRPAGSQP